MIEYVNKGILISIITIHYDTNVSYNKNKFNIPNLDPNWLNAGQHYWIVRFYHIWSSNNHGGCKAINGIKRLTAPPPPPPPRATRHDWWSTPLCVGPRNLGLYCKKIRSAKVQTDLKMSADKSTLPIYYWIIETRDVVLPCHVKQLSNPYSFFTKRERLPKITWSKRQQSNKQHYDNIVYFETITHTYWFNRKLQFSPPIFLVNYSRNTNR